MRRIGLGSLLVLGMLVAGDRAVALPGELADSVTAWIQGHPTLRPASGEKLLVRKTDTAAQRFTFQASVFPPGRAAFPTKSETIRTEQISLFDMINGVTRPRLEESLRVIYGVGIYQDYVRSRVVYAYPNQPALSQAQNQVTPLLASLKGELRMGDRYAYWLEIAQTQPNVAYTGQVTVFLKSDVEKLEAELRQRL